MMSEYIRVQAKSQIKEKKRVPSADYLILRAIERKANNLYD